MEMIPARSSIANADGKTLSILGAVKGGIERAKQLSVKHLSKIGSHAANVRWGNKSNYK